MRRGHLVVLTLFGLAAACGETDEPAATPVDVTDPVDSQTVTPKDVESVDAADVPPPNDTDEPDVNDSLEPDVLDVSVPVVDGDLLSLDVLVTLDGMPVEGATVAQGGRPHRSATTESDGTATLTLDLSVAGDLAVVASHPAARSGARKVLLDALEPQLNLELVAFAVEDNPDYEFASPGTPGGSPNTGFCGHCHLTITEDWHGSVHRRSASNPLVQDLYAGAASTVTDAALCGQLGGTWMDGLDPTSGASVKRCFVGDGVLPSLNDCVGGDCQNKSVNFGGCADCHSPGINGELGGRGLHEATGDAYEFGVHCDVCHRVESVDLDAEAGVAGALKLHRPLEPASASILGKWQPLTFGPSIDSPNVRMGLSPREHFRTAELCAGCHEQNQPALIAGQTIDTQRWPTGRIPVHSTYSEWKAGPMNPGAPCQSCHMPPNPSVSNAADQQVTDAPIGIVGGWLRPPGQVNHHTWDGPRAEASGMLELAAALFLTTTTSDGVVTATVRTKNVGPGHAIPTGEPMRSLVLTVAAHCGEDPLRATGGDAIPAFADSVASSLAGDDWTQWPKAQVGDVIRVVTHPGSFREYEGFGPFGDGTFSTEQKGLRTSLVAGHSTVTAVENGVVTLDVPLSAGDAAYLTRDDRSAGAPGFAFARVLTDAAGRQMVPHFLATDVTIDNRLLPQRSFVSTHQFNATCPAPTVVATLYHRAYPPWLARERGWEPRETKMTEARR